MLQLHCTRDLLAVWHDNEDESRTKLEMWANAQRDGRPAEYRWRPLLNAAVWLTLTTWRLGVVASVVRRMNEVTAHWARLVLGWVTVFGRVYHHGV